ncbi:MAG: efflux transporter outer membrane subunit, partial [Chitinophagaceae bacterium]|nr:efflux transporter outer membrane subunit [Polaromonas sp.]
MPAMPAMPAFPVVIAVALAILTAGCAVGPNYQRPSTPEASAYKESGGWVSAAPADALERGSWWQLFNDPVLNDLAARVEVSNQNVAAAVAGYAQARALVSQQNAALFPSVSLGGGINRAANPVNIVNSNQVNLGAAWAPDVWGRLGRAVDGASALAAASAADLAAAKLSAQGALAVSYLSLRQQDAQLALLASTVQVYERALDITQNRYAAGIVAKTDVLQAQTQLANAKSQAAGLKRQRAQFEHAAAVLTGQLPSSFDIAVKPDWSPQVPDVPLALPSTLLQRRPDIAAAERRVAAANAQIGIAQSA